MEALKVGVIGATGYTGEELVRILCRHRQAKLSYVSGKEERTVRIQEIFPYLQGAVDLECRTFQFEEALGAADLFFLSLPHTVSMQVAPQFLAAGKKVVDVSADYRLKDTSVYEKFYKTAHRDTVNLGSAVYGLPEINRERIRSARLIANPGCYPTGAILALYPGVKAGLFDEQGIIIDAKSGVTGAGRKADKALNFSEVNESFKAYKLFEHQHVPEIDQELGAALGRPMSVTFVPHLLPLNRGILSTIYVRLRKDVTTDDLIKVYADAYRGEPFVKVRPGGALPELRHVAGTNFCDIGLRVNPGKKLAVIVAAIDNLVKGAAGQAVQNMNILSGYDEREGLWV
ncbi:MAG: N-acetyl-gamma-glutamyl-phosphate reductase [Candidatus Omnitrophica bacterium]|nr:N-acetyl-gamma-glutamyl-phosphate reductase [Candidatus Omnitrophota bacterium]